jgi:hypothetical protein
LLSSCRQVRGELEHESLLALTAILQGLQGDHEETLINVLSLQRPNFATLMHITISIPCLAMFSVELQVEIFEDIMPILGLHLSRVTIILEDMRIENPVDPVEILQLSDSLDTDEI